MKSIETIKESIDSDDDTAAYFRRGNLRRSVSEELPTGTGQGNLLKGIDKKIDRRKLLSID